MAFGFSFPKNEWCERKASLRETSTRYELPDGRKVFGKAINENPEEYFTDEILQQLEKAAQKEFLYGKGDDEMPAMMDTVEEELENAEV